MISKIPYIYIVPVGILALLVHFVQQLDVYEHCMTRKNKGSYDFS